jgi:hypothetical protein
VNSDPEDKSDSTKKAKEEETDENMGDTPEKDKEKGDKAHKGRIKIKSKDLEAQEAEVELDPNVPEFVPENDSLWVLIQRTQPLLSLILITSVTCPRHIRVVTFFSQVFLHMFINGAIVAIQYDPYEFPTEVHYLLTLRADTAAYVGSFRCIYHSG